jgi:hypothetical protein
MDSYSTRSAQAQRQSFPIVGKWLIFVSIVLLVIASV